MDVAAAIGAMTLAEKRGLLEALRAAIAEEIAGPAAEPSRCPRCGCDHAVRRGRDASGAQRWLCRGCGRSFTSKTMGLLALSKLPAAVWMEFAECVAAALPLRECAERCGVCLSTAWFMRHRVAEVMRSRLAPFRAGRATQVDGTYLRESLSGDHRRSPLFRMPREPHRNGEDGRDGLVRRTVCVLCGVSDVGDEFCCLASRGKPGAAEVALALSRAGVAPGDGTALATDGLGVYPRAAELAGASHSVAEGLGGLALVNAMHSRLKAFLARFRGVATRRLESYLGWFLYREQFRQTGARDSREAVFADEASGRYERTRRSLVWDPYPFYIDWNRPKRVGGLLDEDPEWWGPVSTVV